MVDIFFGGFSIGKMWKNMEKWLFFPATMAGMGKYRNGRYGRIGVYRVKQIGINILLYLIHT